MVFRLLCKCIRSVVFSVLNLIFLLQLVTTGNWREFLSGNTSDWNFSAHEKKVFSYEADQNQKFHSLLSPKGTFCLQSIVSTSSTSATKLLMCFYFQFLYVISFSFLFSHTINIFLLKVFGEIFFPFSVFKTNHINIILILKMIYISSIRKGMRIGWAEKRKRARIL